MDMHGVASAFTNPASKSNSDAKLLASWVYANNKVHTLLNTLFNELLDVYYNYKEAKEILENIIVKYSAEDVGKQKFVIGIIGL